MRVVLVFSPDVQRVFAGLVSLFSRGKSPKSSCPYQCAGSLLTACLGRILHDSSTEVAVICQHFNKIKPPTKPPGESNGERFPAHRDMATEATDINMASHLQEVRTAKRTNLEPLMLPLLLSLKGRFTQIWELLSSSQILSCPSRYVFCDLIRFVLIHSNLLELSAVGLLCSKGSKCTKMHCTLLWAISLQ